MGVAFAKGHGAENDFVLLIDPDARLRLSVPLVRALCDRRAGLGADGVLRLVRSAALSDVPGEGAPWFMDYRNADGSLAEMCGNGARVFARYLVDHSLAAAGEFLIGTRSGPKTVVVHDTGEVSVNLGPATIGGQSSVAVAGRIHQGLVIDVGNPHLACVLDGQPLDGLDLTRPPEHDPAVFPHGVNVEFLTLTGDRMCRMRVHERGVGETRSCGTGTVAAAVAALHATGHDTGEYTVQTPGGPLHVRTSTDSSWLTGPAVIVATGELTGAWWAQASGR